MANKKPAGSKDQPIENFMKPMSPQPVNYNAKWGDALGTVRRADEARTANIAQNAKLAQQSLNASAASGGARTPAARGNGVFSNLISRFGGGLKGSSK